MTDIYDDVAWCLDGATEDKPLALDGLISCIDYRQHMIATRDEIAAALLRLRGEGRVAGTAAGGYYPIEPGHAEGTAFAGPTQAEHETAYAAYDERMRR
ncbi:MAG TPA: hypothetical protein VF092_19130 [Longimicrobium sp.]